MKCIPNIFEAQCLSAAICRNHNNFFRFYLIGFEFKWKGMTDAMMNGLKFCDSVSQLVIPVSTKRRLFNLLVGIL